MNILKQGVLLNFKFLWDQEILGQKEIKNEINRKVYVIF